MIITCPSCLRRYMIDETTFDEKGRMVRCSMCGHTWHQQKIIQELTPAHQEKDAATANSKNMLVPRPEHPYRLNWLIYFTVVATLLSVFIIGHATFISLWPPVEKVYKVIGLPYFDTKSHLKIENVETRVIKENTKKQIIISGVLHNTSSESIAIPPLRVLFIGPCSQGNFQKVKKVSSFKDSCYLEKRHFQASENRLLPNEKIHFETPGYHPPTQSKGVIVTF